ncbi:hypothetical protein [Rhodococcus sp. NPDC058521]|uniref:hypothetical protein n=1 Tax=Rhodococcus sp. NPDC058521 TaxID=3346536 RepID=UPI003664F8C2
MSARNRVTPFSDIVAIALRGLFMGNRGCLHRDGDLVRHHSGKRWITCDTDFRDRKVEQWAQGRYTVLFFHDEAVALAAGHRPCAECRRPCYNAFREAWGGRPSADEMDARLHRERLGERPTADWSTLPHGAFVCVDALPMLVTQDSIVPWSVDGYGVPTPRPRTGQVTVLTPASTVAVLGAGYEPLLAI